jgi:hypothetical protein
LLEEAESEGRLSLHKLSAAEARVEILFIRSRDAFLFSALRNFEACALRPQEWAEAAE